MVITGTHAFGMTGDCPQGLVPVIVTEDPLNGYYQSIKESRGQATPHLFF